VGRQPHCIAYHVNDGFELCRGGPTQVGNKKKNPFFAEKRTEACAGIKVSYVKCM
jgi:hypothetical protein